MIRLRIETGDAEFVRAFRQSPVVIGHDEECDLALPAELGVARFHCRLACDGGGYRVEHLGSPSPTLRNGRPCVQEEVEKGDVIEIGGTRIHVLSMRRDEPTSPLFQQCRACGSRFAARMDGCPVCKAPRGPLRRSRKIHAKVFPGFRLIRKIGSGGMGIVFEAEDLRNDRRVALKVLRPHLSRDPAYLARFVEEVRVLSSLHDDRIVQVFERGLEDSLVFLTMELVDGPSARDAIRTWGYLPWDEAARIAWSAARALNAAYQQAGVVHGDVKPGNFLLTRGGRVKLCDFGLARVDLRGGPSRDRGRENERRGTAAYAAPERFKEEPASVKSDIYSLGVSLFQMATGDLPFSGGSVAELREAHRFRPVPLLKSRVPGVNPALQMLLEKMMAKSPGDRHRDYPELISDLSLLVEI